MTSIYLDYNATTPLYPSVLRKMLDVFSLVGNPASIHGFGRQVRAHLENSRQVIGEYLNVPAERLYFTSGGTEANNMVLQTFLDRAVLVAATEHDCVYFAHPNPQVIPVMGNGLLNLQALEELLAQQTQQGGLVSVMLANNETGVIQPIQDIAEIVHRYGFYMHTDACQALGKIPVNLNKLGVDYATFSAHKIGGPAGIGLVYAREKCPFDPLLLGGGQERGKRSGLQSVSLAVGFAEALTANSLDAWASLESMRNWIENQLLALNPGVKILAQDVPRIPNTTCVTMPGVSQETQVMAFDLEGIAVSAGSACSSGKIEISRVLLAVGLSPEEAGTAVRISLGPQTTQDDVARCIETWAAIFKRSSKEVIAYKG